MEQRIINECDGPKRQSSLVGCGRFCSRKGSRTSGSGVGRRCQGNRQQRDRLASRGWFLVNRVRGSEPTTLLLQLLHSMIVILGNCGRKGHSSRNPDTTLPVCDLHIVGPIARPELINVL